VIFYAIQHAENWKRKFLRSELPPRDSKWSFNYKCRSRTDNGTSNTSKIWSVHNAQGCEHIHPQPFFFFFFFFCGGEGVLENTLL